MIVISSNGECSHLKDHLHRLRGLIADFEALSRGVHPDVSRFDDAPVLHDWSSAARLVPCLLGTVRNHPTVADGRLVKTSDLWVHAPELGYARTLSRLYRLGTRSMETRR